MPEIENITEKTGTYSLRIAADLVEDLKTVAAALNKVR